MRYEIQMVGLGNTWTDDDEPVTFASYEEADQELQDYLEQIRAAVARGDMTDGYSRDEFIIVETLGYRPDGEDGWVEIVETPE